MTDFRPRDLVRCVNMSPLLGFNGEFLQKDRVYWVARAEDATPGRFVHLWLRTMEGAALHAAFNSARFELVARDARWAPIKEAK